MPPTTEPRRARWRPANAREDLIAAEATRLALEGLAERVRDTFLDLGPRWREIDIGEAEDAVLALFSDKETTT